MARGLGSTSGSGTSDKITTSFTSHNQYRTYAFWMYRTSGGSQFGRVFDKRTGGSEVELAFVDTGAPFLKYVRVWDGSPREWVTASGTYPTNEWIHTVITYDSGSTSNNAIIYKNGTALSLSNPSPSGTIATNSDAYVIGNRGNDNARCFGGILAEFAIWDRIITADEAAILAKGYSPLFLNTDPVLYTDLIRDAYDKMGTGTLTPSGTTVTTHPPVIYPAYYPLLKSAGATPPPTPTLEQHSYRWRDDDGSESAATFLASLNTNITRAKETTTRLRVLIDADNDPTSGDYQLEYREKGSGDAWAKI